MSEIAEILRAYPPDCHPTQVEPLGNAGGLSGAQFWRLVAPRGALGLRCWPIEHPSLERLEFIHAVLRHATAGGPDFLPVPITTSTGTSIVQKAGRLWEMTPWLPGAADYEQSPSAEKLRSAMVALAKFHVAVGDFPASTQFAPAPAISQRLKRLRELKSGGTVELIDAIDDKMWPELAPSARRFAAELPRVVPAAITRLTPLAQMQLPLQICVRDVWSENILFTGDTVSGIVDFGAVDVDTPATDIARLLGSLAGDDATGWRTGLDAYASVRPLTNDESLVVPLLDIAGTILAGRNWLRWIYVERREFSDTTRVIERFIRITKRIARISS